MVSEPVCQTLTRRFILTPAFRVKMAQDKSARCSMETYPLVFWEKMREHVKLWGRDGSAHFVSVFTPSFLRFASNAKPQLLVCQVPSFWGLMLQVLDCSFFFLKKKKRNRKSVFDTQKWKLSKIKGKMVWFFVFWQTPAACRQPEAPESWVKAVPLKSQCQALLNAGLRISQHCPC